MTQEIQPKPADDADEQERIRALLANSADLDPMPAAVSDRIRFSLAEEQHRRAPASFASSAPQSEGSTQTGKVTDLSARRNLRHPVRVLAVAASAAVLLLGGGAIGYAGLQQNTAPPVAAPAAQPSNLADRVSVGHTGDDYTSTGLASQAASLLNSPLRRSVDPQVVQKYGAIATSRGIVNCLGSLGTALAANPDRITVDFARYKGKPAVIVVLTKASTSTAWVVGTDCRKSSAPLAGPTSVTT